MGKNAKRFDGMEEKMVMSNSSYFILNRNGEGSFDAYPITDWYKMRPAINYRTLNAEEAEQEFSARNKRDAITRQMIRMKMNPEDPAANENQGNPSSKERHSSDDNQEKEEKEKIPKTSEYKSDDDDDYVESMEVDYMSDSSEDDDKRINQTNEEPNKIPDDDLNVALSNENKYGVDDDDSDTFHDVSEDSEPTKDLASNQPKTSKNLQSRKRAFDAGDEDSEDDVSDDEDDDENDDDDDFEALENTYSNLSLKALGVGDIANNEAVDNLMQESTSSKSSTSETNFTSTNNNANNNNSSGAKIVQPESKHELENCVQRLVVASLKGKSITSTELMQKVTDGLTATIPRNMLVKMVGDAMKKCKFTRRVINNAVYFSMK